MNQNLKKLRSMIVFISKQNDKKPMLNQLFHSQIGHLIKAYII